MELTLRAKNADGSGAGQTTLPLRVAAWHDYSLEHEDEWMISSAGGLPLAMLTNLGNAPTTISVEVLGLPEGWTLDGPDQVSLGVGESAGIPISALPPSSQTDYNTSVTLRTLDEANTQREVTLDLIYSERSWATSPILFGTSGDSLELQFNPGFDVLNVQHGGSTLPQTDDGEWLMTVPVMDSNGEIVVDGVSLNYWARVRDPPSRMGSCAVNQAVGESTAPLASCSIQNGTSAIQWTAILRDQNGVVIDHTSGDLQANTTLASINLSGSNWQPTPGKHVVRASLYDGNGGLIAESSRTIMIRDTDWNLGITSVELLSDDNSQEIVVSISRENPSKLVDSICFIHLTSGSWEAIHRIDVAGNLAPQIRVQRPDLSEGSTVNVELKCDAPWDEDNNENDNVNLIVLPAGIVAQSESLDYPMLLGSLIIVFGIMGLLGMIRPDTGPKRIERRQRIRKKTTPTKVVARESDFEEDEDIHLEDEDDLKEIEDDFVEFDDKPDATEIEPVEPERPLDDFEARLERLRKRREKLGGN